jgi:PIN domain nuclease of toxin-antitoxin system
VQALLLDTHVWLWMVTRNRDRMPAFVWTQLATFGERNALAVSEVSFWEIALRAAKKQLTFEPNTREWLKRAGRAPGLGVIQIDREVMVRSTELDIPVRDPADRMLIATALQYDLRLATADARLLAYAADNPRLGVLDCRLA